jgi:septal ring factor EnvC (AmiA/AmiB activator)
MDSRKRSDIAVRYAPVMLIVLCLAACRPTANDSELQRLSQEVQKQNAGFEKKISELAASRTNEGKLQERLDSVERQLVALKTTVDSLQSQLTELNEKTARAGRAETEALSQKTKKDAVAAFAKILSATQIGVSYRDYGAMLIETKTNYESVRTTLPESVRNHLDSALRSLLAANTIWENEIKFKLDPFNYKDKLSAKWADAQREVTAAKE